MSKHKHSRYKCEICGNKIVGDYIIEDYVYKVCTGKATLYFCSWGCLRKYKEKHQPKRKPYLMAK